MKLKDRIDELEKRVRELEARPQIIYLPVFQPAPNPYYVTPVLPYFPYQVTCTSSGSVTLS